MTNKWSKPDKAWLLISTMLLALATLFAFNDAKADQQGFDEFVSRAKATEFSDVQLTRMILGKHYDCELHVASVTVLALENFNAGVNRDNAVLIETAVDDCYNFNEEVTLGFVKLLIENKHPEWFDK